MSRDDFGECFLCCLKPEKNSGLKFESIRFTNSKLGSLKEIRCPS